MDGKYTKSRYRQFVHSFCYVYSQNLQKASIYMTNLCLNIYNDKKKILCITSIPLPLLAVTHILNTMRPLFRLLLVIEDFFSQSGVPS